MDYTNLKKDELLAVVFSLENKIEEQKHLASAVDAKDAEIARLSKQIAENKAETVKEVNELKNKIAELKGELHTHVNNKDAIKKLEEENKRLVAFGNQYISVFRNTLKSLQGTLDNAIELNDILLNGVKEK